MVQLKKKSIFFVSEKKSLTRFLKLKCFDAAFDPIVICLAKVTNYSCPNILYCHPIISQNPLKHFHGWQVEPVVWPSKPVAPSSCVSPQRGSSLSVTVSALANASVWLRGGIWKCSSLYTFVFRCRFPGARTRAKCCSSCWCFSRSSSSAFSTRCSPTWERGTCCPLLAPRLNDRRCSVDNKAW